LKIGAASAAPEAYASNPDLRSTVPREVFFPETSHRVIVGMCPRDCGLDALRADGGLRRHNAAIRQTFREQSMKRTLALLTMFVALGAGGALGAANDDERTVKEIRFEAGSTSAVLKGRITGHHYVDHQLRAGAGQTIKASMKGSNGANYFNLIAPGSGDVAMHRGQISGNRFEGMLPVEGIYTLRVYLMRSAARRNETGDYTLDVAVTGKPLKPLPASQDALVPGTPYHASTTIPCSLPYDAETRHCEAFVIRRGVDGTATVEVRGPRSHLRRVLFVQGKPAASDASEPMSFSRRGDITEVKFGDAERVEIFDALVAGG
jgi:hypothetical protein